MAVPLGSQQFQVPVVVDFSDVVLMELPNLLTVIFSHGLVVVDDVSSCCCFYFETFMSSSFPVALASPKTLHAELAAFVSSPVRSPEKRNSEAVENTDHCERVKLTISGYTNCVPFIFALPMYSEADWPVGLALPKLLQKVFFLNFTIKW